MLIHFKESTIFYFGKIVLHKRCFFFALIMLFIIITNNKCIWQTHLPNICSIKHKEEREKKNHTKHICRYLIIQPDCNANTVLQAILDLMDLRSFQNLPKVRSLLDHSCAILISFKIVVLFNNTSTEIKTKSADVLLKSTTIVKEMRIAQLWSKSKRTLDKTIWPVAITVLKPRVYFDETKNNSIRFLLMITQKTVQGILNLKDFCIVFIIYLNKTIWYVAIYY